MKRGQITVFVILGLLILIAVSVYWYSTYVRVVEPVLVEEKVPREIVPVYEFIRSCLQSVAKEGLLAMGFQGGFISIPPVIDRNHRAFLQLDPSGVAKIPFWFYEGEDRAPSISYMEKELGVFVRDSLQGCIGNFESLKPQFFVKSLEEIRPRVSFGQKDVVVEANWPLQIDTAGFSTKHDLFVARVDVPMRAVWELANSTIVAENKLQFFENLTVNLMAADPEIPMDGLEFECGVKRWPLPVIRERLQDLLFYNIPSVRVENTNYVPFQASRRTYETVAKGRSKLLADLDAGKKPVFPTDVPDDSYEFFNLLMHVGASPTDLKIGFSYDSEWGLLLNAKPREGFVLKSNLMRGPSKWLRYLCMNQYHFVYDIVYPVLVTIRSDDALRGEGYLFQFAFPVLVSENAGDRKFFGFRRFDSSEYPADYCERLTDRVVSLRAKGFVPGVPVALELDNANFSYQCRDEDCLLGSVQPQEGHYQLITRVPHCGNPVIVANRDGYLSNKGVLIGSDRELELFLHKLGKFEVEVVKHKFFAEENRLASSEKLGKNEIVSVYVSLRNGTLDQVIEFPQNESQFLEFVEADMNYDITIMLRDIFGNVIGGYSADNILLSFDEGKTKVVLHVLEYRPAPATADDRAKMLSVMFDGKVGELLRPEFK